MSSRIRPRIAALTAAVVLAVAGCSATNAITTQFDYSASDGVQVDLGDVRGYNLLFVAGGADELGVLIGSLVNSGVEAVDVSLSVDGVATTDVMIAPGEIVYLGPGEGHLLVTGVPSVLPGLSVTVVVLTAATGAVTVTVPSTDATLPEYAAVLDQLTAITPPEPSPLPEPSPEPSPAPSPSPEPDDE